LSTRVNIIRKLIELNENLFFYPKIRIAYQKLHKENHFNIVFDIGTNKGQTIKQFKAVNPKIFIYGFEPNKKHYNNLLNSNDENLKMFNAGCSNIDGELLFHENMLDESSTFENVDLNSNWLNKKAKILGTKPKNLIQKSYKVTCIKLSTFFQKNKVKLIDLVKIDVEGHEYQVLEGIFEKKETLIKFIQIENHNDDLYLNTNRNKINKLLKDNNFKEFISISHGFGNIQDIIYKNGDIDA
tara:strand:- start:4798 stop:5520 length:723 start_codon:yes stop_codon:yes gene_type:complete